MKIFGIMTGTSLDAVDVALVEFENEDTVHIITHDYFEISKSMKNKILKISQDAIHISEISSLNFAISEIYYQAIKEFTDKYLFDINDCDAIGIHGQTLWHQPEPVNFSNINIASTLQLGNASYLAKKTGLKVVSDFRSGDIALGGQGAPLVPIFDKYYLFTGNNIFTLNIGGIANIAFFPESNNENEIVAFDTGPGNVLIDIMMNYYYDMKYDENGEIAKSGKLISELHNNLMELEFIKRKGPKSTGRELFNIKLLKDMNIDEYEPKDVIRTLTEFTATTISESIKEFNVSDAEIIASGGGVRNEFLMDLIKSKLKGYSVKNSYHYGLPSDAKEAVCFAYLAYLNLNNIPGNIPSVTGAKRKTILGSVSYP